MSRRELKPDALTQHQAAVTAAAEKAETARFTAGLPQARPTTAGEKHAFELAQKADSSSSPKVLKRVLIHGTWITVGLVSAIVAGNRESHEAPDVGECARYDGSDKLEKVDCDDDAAKYRVTSRVDDESDGDIACAADPRATSYYSYQSGHGIVEFVLCLAHN
jgi:hypothetical protein